MPKKPKTISQQLRDAILGAPKSRYAIAKETGVTEASLSRFVNGVTGLSMDSIDKIGECLGLVIKAETKNRKGK